ncbi:hypothetical protein DL98DRAFT_639309 [Cadophora sp. DSE1049]|nr:hypothetical protein DL98DRAFT_639309 [Cadophora sp. DSE1049]
MPPLCSAGSAALPLSAPRGWTNRQCAVQIAALYCRVCPIRQGQARQGQEQRNSGTAEILKQRRRGAKDDPPALGMEPCTALDWTGLNWTGFAPRPLFEPAFPSQRKTRSEASLITWALGIDGY